MAQNEMDSGARLNNILSKRFEIEGAPAPFMASELFPNVVLELDRPEWKWLANEKPGWGYRFQAAVAGQYSFVALSVSQDSVLVVVEAAYVWSPAQCFIGIDNDIASYTSSGTFYARDSRFGYEPTGVKVRNVASAAALIPDMWYVQAAPGGVTSMPGVVNVLPAPVVLHKGFSLVIRTGTQNTNLTAGFVWREREASPGELRAARGP